MSLQPGHLPPAQDAGSDNPAQIRQHARQIAQAVHTIMQGGLNNVTSTTLLPNTTSTVLQDSRLSASGSIHLDPLTASAAAELAAGTVFVAGADRTKGSYVITHSNSSAIDRSFRVIIIG